MSEPQAAISIARSIEASEAICPQAKPPAVAFSVLWGTLFPILSEAVRGTKITVGPPFFNRVNIPLGLLLLALTEITEQKQAQADLAKIAQFAGIGDAGRDYYRPP